MPVWPSWLGSHPVSGSTRVQLLPPALYVLLDGARQREQCRTHANPVRYGWQISPSFAAHVSFGHAMESASCSPPSSERSMFLGRGLSIFIPR